MKEYLSNAPISVPPVLGRSLILYLAIHENSMGFILGQYNETRRKEWVVYYLSKKFIDYESKYPFVEKICYALA